MSGTSITIEQQEGTVLVHGLFDLPLSVQYLTADEAESEMRSAVTLMMAQLRMKAIGSEVKAR